MRPFTKEQLRSEFTIAARVRRATAQSIAHAATTALAFSAEDFDLGDLWVSTANTKLTAPAGGYYRMSACAQWDEPPGTGLRRLLAIRLNGSAALATAEVVAGPAATFPSLVVATDYLLAKGDYVEAVVFHTETVAAALNIIVTGVVPSFSMHRFL